MNPLWSMTIEIDVPLAALPNNAYRTTDELPVDVSALHRDLLTALRRHVEDADDHAVSIHLDRSFS